MSWASAIEQVKVIFKINPKTTKVKNKKGNLNVEGSTINNAENITYNTNYKIYSEDISFLIKKYFLNFKGEDLKFNSYSYKEIIDWIEKFKLRLEFNNLEIKNLKDEKLLKILNFLSAVLLDEEKETKELYYIYDIKQILDEKNYITFSDKLSFSQICLALKMTKNYYDVINNEKLLSFYQENHFFPFLDCKTLVILNDETKEGIQFFRVTEVGTKKYRPVLIYDLENNFMFQNIINFTKEQRPEKYSDLLQKFLYYSSRIKIKESYYLDLNHILKFDFFDIAQQPFFIVQEGKENKLGLITNQDAFLKPTEKIIYFLNNIDKIK